MRPLTDKQLKRWYYPAIGKLERDWNETLVIRTFDGSLFEIPKLDKSELIEYEGGLVTFYYSKKTNAVKEYAIGTFPKPDGSVQSEIANALTQENIRRIWNSEFSRIWGEF